MKTGCMEIRFDGRSPAGKQRKTWIENVEADMAELEVNREDIKDRKEWRHTAMKRKSNPIRKRTMNG